MNWRPKVSLGMGEWAAIFGLSLDVYMDSVCVLYWAGKREVIWSQTDGYKPYNVPRPSEVGQAEKNTCSG